MTDPEPNALLASIRAAPDDDAPRHVLADWYEAHGDIDRASFIRKQLERAQLPEWDRQVILLELQERALLEANEARWRETLPEVAGVEWGSFHRGVVSKATFESMERVAEVANDCFGATPLRGIITRWPQIGQRPDFEPQVGLRELTIVGPILDIADIEWLAESPLLSTISTLNLVESAMTADELAVILASEHLARIKVLRLPLHGFGLEGVERLVQSSLPALSELDLSVMTLVEIGGGERDEPTIGDNGAEALARWPVLQQLTALDLTGNQLGEAGLSSLLSSPKLAGLKKLGLRGVCDYDFDLNETPDIFAAFERASEHLRLDELDIGENEFSQQRWTALTECPTLSNLKVLRADLHLDRPLPANAWRAPCFESLRMLSALNSVIIEGLFDDRDPGSLAHLHTLEMTSDHGWFPYPRILSVLAGGPPLTALLQLTLSAVDGIEVIWQSKAFPGLRAVYVDCADPFHRDYFEQPGAVDAVFNSQVGRSLVSLEIHPPEFARLPRNPRVALNMSPHRGPLRLF